MNLKRQILSILISALTLTSFAQSYSVLKLEESNPHFPEDKYTFPILTGPNARISNKINTFLVKDQLDIAYGQEESSIFENVWQTPDEPVARINYLTYQKELLNAELYTVTISGEFCSAYCEGYDLSYTFDLHTGDLLTLDMFFNPAGKEKLLEELIDYKTQLIDEKVREIERIIKSDGLGSNGEVNYQDILELYMNCNSEYADLESFRFIPGQDSIKIIYGRCSAHYNRDLDELWYFQKDISIDKWTDLLSEFGKGKLKN